MSSNGGNRLGDHHTCLFSDLPRKKGAPRRCFLCHAPEYVITPQELHKIRTAFTELSTYDHSTGTIPSSDVMRFLHTVNRGASNVTYKRMVEVFHEEEWGKDTVTLDTLLKGLMTGEAVARQVNDAELTLIDFGLALANVANIGLKRPPYKERLPLWAQGVTLFRYLVEKIMGIHFEKTFKRDIIPPVVDEPDLTSPRGDILLVELCNELLPLIKRVYHSFTHIGGALVPNDMTIDMFHLVIRDVGMFASLPNVLVTTVFNDSLNVPDTELDKGWGRGVRRKPQIILRPKAQISPRGLQGIPDGDAVHLMPIDPFESGLGEIGFGGGRGGGGGGDGSDDDSDADTYATSPPATPRTPQVPKSSSSARRPLEHRYNEEPSYAERYKAKEDAAFEALEAARVAHVPVSATTTPSAIGTGPLGQTSAPPSRDGTHGADRTPRSLDGFKPAPVETGHYPSRSRGAGVGGLTPIQDASPSMTTVTRNGSPRASRDYAGTARGGSPIASIQKHSAAPTPREGSLAPSPSPSPSLSPSVNRESKASDPPVKKLTLETFTHALFKMLREGFKHGQSVEDIEGEDSYTAIIGTTGITPEIISKRALLYRLKMIYEVYRPAARLGPSTIQRSYFVRIEAYDASMASPEAMSSPTRSVGASPSRRSKKNKKDKKDTKDTKDKGKVEEKSLKQGKRFRRASILLKNIPGLTAGDTRWMRQPSIRVRAPVEASKSSKTIGEVADDGVSKKEFSASAAWARVRAAKAMISSFQHARARVTRESKLRGTFHSAIFSRSVPQGMEDVGAHYEEEAAETEKTSEQRRLSKRVQKLHQESKSLGGPLNYYSMSYRSMRQGAGMDEVRAAISSAAEREYRGPSLDEEVGQGGGRRMSATKTHITAVLNMNDAEILDYFADKQAPPDFSAEEDQPARRRRKSPSKSPMRSSEPDPKSFLKKRSGNPATFASSRGKEYARRVTEIHTKGRNVEHHDDVDADLPPAPAEEDDASDSDSWAGSVSSRESPYRRVSPQTRKEPVPVQRRKRRDPPPVTPVRKPVPTYADESASSAAAVRSAARAEIMFQKRDEVAEAATREFAAANRMLRAQAPEDPRAALGLGRSVSFRLRNGEAIGDLLRAPGAASPETHEDDEEGGPALPVDEYDDVLGDMVVSTARGTAAERAEQAERRRLLRASYSGLSQGQQQRIISLARVMPARQLSKLLAKHSTAVASTAILPAPMSRDDSLVRVGAHGVGGPLKLKKADVVHFSPHPPTTKPAGRSSRPQIAAQVYKPTMERNASNFASAPKLRPVKPLRMASHSSPRKALERKMRKLQRQIAKTAKTVPDFSLK